MARRPPTNPVSDVDRLDHPRYWLTWIGTLLWRLVSVFPSRIRWIVGHVLGLALYHLLPARRRVAARNIDACFTQWSVKRRRRLLKDHFASVGQSVFDLGVAVWSTSSRFHGMVRVEGISHLQQARARNRPVILLAPHFVTLPISALYLIELQPIIAMYKRPRNQLVHAGYRRVCNGSTTSNALLDRLIRKRNSTHELKLVEHRRGMRPIVRALRSGVAFYYLPDQDLGRRHAVFAPFFGIEAATVTAVSRFASLTDALVILCWSRQLPFGSGYEINFSEPLHDFPSNDEQRDAERINLHIEEIVRNIPEQYFWLHKRFKTRPVGDTPFYE